MNLLDIVNEELDDREYTLEEGIFEVSPAIALFAFKDNILNKGKALVKKATDPVKTKVGKAASEIEKAKAKTIGQSGFKDTDTVYKFTKKQKEVMAYIYNKYGPVMVNEITKFRKEVLAPYQIIKRSIAKNHSLSNKEIHGMTKEEYFKYRESGRRKIEAKGHFFKDTKDMKESRAISKESLERARKVYNDFKMGKIIDLTSTNVERVLSDAGLGREKMYGWSESELEKTSTKIKEIEGLLNDPNRAEEGNMVRVSHSKNNARATRESREVLEMRLKSLYEHGYSYAVNKTTDAEGRKNKGPFKEAFANYMLRRNQIISMRSSMTNKKFREYYEKILKDAVNSADKVYEDKLKNYADFRGKSELNKMEKKIWGLKLTGVEYSGNINDWYLKIKPENFMDNSKYYKKTDNMIEAEKEMDKQLKQFERKLKESMSDEDVALCKKYRLFNNLLTVKQFKNADDMFKDGSDIKKLKSEKKYTLDDFRELISNASNKEYTSIRELEDEQNRLKEISDTIKLSSDDKDKLKDFLNRKDPKNNSEMNKLDSKTLSNIIDDINSKEYTGTTQAKEDLNDLEVAESSFKKKYGEIEMKKHLYDVQQAKDKINGYLAGRED